MEPLKNIIAVISETIMCIQYQYSNEGRCCVKYTNLLLCHAGKEVVSNVRRRMIEPALTVSTETSEVVPATVNSISAVISSDIWLWREKGGNGLSYQMK